MRILLPSPRPHRRRPRHAARAGFSTLAIIASMVFIAMAVMAMTTLFAHEAHRTRASLAQSQLRQLLLAAVPAAQAEVRTPGRRDVALAVPVNGASVTLHVDGPAVRVTAVYRGFTAAQSLVFENGTLASATLDQTGGQ